MNDAWEKAQHRDLSVRRAGLSASKRALLERRLRGDNLGAPGVEIPALPRSSQLVPSFAQERLWFLQQFDPSAFAYNEFAAYRIRGGIDPELLDRTIEAIIERHAVLRTGFSIQSGRLTAEIYQIPPFRTRVLDVRHLNEREREEHLVRLGRLEAREPFDLERPPFIRATLLRLQPGEDALFLTLHHIISDGWSTGILLREFNTIYNALNNTPCSRSVGVPPPVSRTGATSWTHRSDLRSATTVSVVSCPSIPVYGQPTCALHRRRRHRKCIHKCISRRVLQSRAAFSTLIRAHKRSPLTLFHGPPACRAAVDVGSHNVRWITTRRREQPLNTEPVCTENQILKYW